METKKIQTLIETSLQGKLNLVYLDKVGSYYNNFISKYF